MKDSTCNFASSFKKQLNRCIFLLAKLAFSLFIFNVCLFCLIVRANTKGSNYKLHSRSFRYDLLKHFFSARIVNSWNIFRNSVVDACSVNAFQIQLDKFWQHQAVKFDFTADQKKS